MNWKKDAYQTESLENAVWLFRKASMIFSRILYFVFRAVSIEYFCNYGISLYPIFSSIKYDIFLHTNTIEVQMYGSPVLETWYLCEALSIVSPNLTILWFESV